MAAIRKTVGPTFVQVRSGGDEETRTPNPRLAKVRGSGPCEWAAGHGAPSWSASPHQPPLFPPNYRSFWHVRGTLVQGVVSE